jgi:APA family basic amino acid/polyamine antiporter
VLTIAACIYVLSGLAAITWVIFGCWLAVIMALLLPDRPSPVAAQ